MDVLVLFDVIAVITLLMLEIWRRIIASRPEVAYVQSYNRGVSWEKPNRSDYEKYGVYCSFVTLEVVVGVCCIIAALATANLLLGQFLVLLIIVIVGLAIMVWRLLRPQSRGQSNKALLAAGRRVWDRDWR